MSENQYRINKINSLKSLSLVRPISDLHGSSVTSTARFVIQASLSLTSERVLVGRRRPQRTLTTICNAIFISLHVYLSYSFFFCVNDKKKTSTMVISHYYCYL